MKINAMITKKDFHAKKNRIFKSGGCANVTLILCARRNLVTMTSHSSKIHMADSVDISGHNCFQATV